MKSPELTEFFSLLGKAKKEKKEEFDNLLKKADINLDVLTSSVVTGIKEAKVNIKKQKKKEEKLIEQLDSIITRVGENSRIIFCGDASQSDLVKTNDRNGIHDFLNILRKMPSFDIIEYGIDDIVRSGLVKEYIISKLEVGL